MSLWTRYQAIQALKNDGRCVVNGVNFANVIATYLYDESWIGVIKKLIFSLFYRSVFETDVNISAGEVEFIVFYSCRFKKRPDYDFIPEKIKSLLGSRQSYIEAVERFSLRQLISTLFYFPDSFRRLVGFRQSLLSRILAALLLAKYRSSHEILVRIEGKWSQRTLITFCDAHPLESLITQIVTLHGGLTYTNQHGQYRVLDESNISPDAEAYANFISDKILCWGEATVREFMKYGVSRERCIVIGWIKRLRLHSSDFQKSANSFFGVMLNGENGKASNLLLLKWANRLADILDLSYYVRLHPTNRKEDYVTLVSERCLALQRMAAREFFSEVSFCLAHMTGGTVEALEVNCPIYLMDDGRLADVFRKEGLSFTSFEDLLSMVKSDISASCQAEERCEALRVWFNDDHDHDHDIRLMSAIS
jgi:hypothetical protein